MMGMSSTPSLSRWSELPFVPTVQPDTTAACVRDWFVAVIHLIVTESEWMSSTPKSLPVL
jgi:hypothetical protein